MKTEAQTIEALKARLAQPWSQEWGKRIDQFGPDYEKLRPADVPGLDQEKLWKLWSGNWFANPGPYTLPKPADKQWEGLRNMTALLADRSKTLGERFRSARDACEETFSPKNTRLPIILRALLIMEGGTLGTVATKEYTNLLLNWAGKPELNYDDPQSITEALKNVAEITKEWSPKVGAVTVGERARVAWHLSELVKAESGKESKQMSEPKEIAIAALRMMLAKVGPDAEFPGDAIWQYADEEVDSLRKPPVFKMLSTEGYLEDTGEKTNAVTPERRSAPATKYRFGPLLNPRNQASQTTPSQVAGAFSSTCKNVLRVHDTACVRICASLLSKRFLILTGLAGSGKTKIAQAFARWITPRALPSNPLKPGSKIQGATKEYTVIDSGSQGIQLDDEGKIVFVPMPIIEEWADYITKNQVSEEISGRDLRDKVEPLSKFTPHLHRQETHYKPVAFALVKARQSPQPAKCYEVVPVGADWTGNDHVLGYPNGLDPSSYVTRPALDLMLHAQAHPAVPHFLILDEMNLSHVERYFADLLSLIESKESLTLYCDKKGADGKAENTRGLDPILKLPPNLFIIGTVNVDETTYMFSPKVLDRANVIEFRVSSYDMKAFLEQPLAPKLEDLDGMGFDAGFATPFVNAANGDAPALTSPVKERYESEMKLFFEVLQGHGAEFGYRVAHESARFIHHYQSLGAGKVWDPEADAGEGRKGKWADKDAAQRDWFDHAFDAIAVQKFLPKLHGSKVKLGPLLKKLYTVSIQPPGAEARTAISALEKQVDPSREIPREARYPLTAEKISRMWRQLNENGFTSFPEN